VGKTAAVRGGVVLGEEGGDGGAEEFGSKGRLSQV